MPPAISKRVRRDARTPNRTAPARRLALACLLLLGATRSVAQTPISQDAILQRLERLEQEQRELRQQLKEKDERLNQLESELKKAQQAQERAVPPAAPAAVAAPAAPAPAEAPLASDAPVVAAGDEAQAPRFFGTYTPGRGFGLASTKYGDLTFSAYSYVRYLNQKGLDKTYVNGLGQTVELDRRNDVQLNKVILYFKGWLLDPKFRYLFYTWTNNTSQGLGAQVVVGGNLTYAFNDALQTGAGIAALPTVRSNEGSWPYFLGVDHRTLSDEFFRGSYTTGFFASGEPLDGLRYIAMLGNNLSQLGVDAGQLDGDFATVSTALWWMPTTGEFGPHGEFGDYADHQDLATRVGTHFTFSPEDKQEQPGTEDPDNAQIRLSNGTIVFTDGALAPGVQVNDVDYYMTSFDSGLKYRGFSLEGEYYLRWLNDFNANGPLPIGDIFDHGFQLQTSMMVWPQTVQLYGTGAYVFGDFGDPWELSAGFNWWIFQRRELRLNLEYIYDRKSPVGYFAIPQAVGGTGSIFDANLELIF